MRTEEGTPLPPRGFAANGYKHEQPTPVQLPPTTPAGALTTPHGIAGSLPTPQGSMQAVPGAGGATPATGAAAAATPGTAATPPAEGLQASKRGPGRPKGSGAKHGRVHSSASASHLSQAVPRYTPPDVALPLFMQQLLALVLQTLVRGAATSKEVPKVSMPEACGQCSEAVPAMHHVEIPV